MNFCYNCGQQLPIGREKFCPNCGEKLEESDIGKIEIGGNEGDVIGADVGGTGNFIGRKIRYTVQGNVINIHVDRLSTNVLGNLKKIVSLDTQLPTMTDSKEENKNHAVNLAEIRQMQERITEVLNNVIDIEKKEGRQIQKIEAGDLQLFKKDLLAKNVLAKATVLYYTGSYHEALLWYDKVIELDGSKPDVWYNKGIINGKLEQNNTAIKCFDKAIELKPDYAKAWYNMGVCLGKIGKYRQAIKCFDKVKEIGMLVQ